MQIISVFGRHPMKYMKGNHRRKNLLVSLILGVIGNTYNTPTCKSRGAENNL